jgi:hypothetical protein
MCVSAKVLPASAMNGWGLLCSATGAQNTRETNALFSPYGEKTTVSMVQSKVMQYFQIARAYNRIGLY